MKREKSVDESWKESAAQEKERLQNIGGAKMAKTASASEAAGRRAEPSGAYETEFVNYISSLAYQAMIFLGEIPNPVTDTTEKNPEQAKFVIDTLILIREKTKGNLTRKEEDVLNTAAYELQMKYVESTSSGEKADV